MNKQIRELSIDELDQVSGGNVIDVIVNAYLAAVGKNLMQTVHTPAPKMTMHMR